MSRIASLFTEHPASVDESYGEHFMFALRSSTMLFAAAGAALPRVAEGVVGSKGAAGSTAVA